MRIRRGRLREQAQQFCPEQKDRTDAADLPGAERENKCSSFAQSGFQNPRAGLLRIFLVEKRAQTCIINSVCKDFDS